MDKTKMTVRSKLSALWATLMFLYVYADVLSLYRPGHLDKIQRGEMGPFDVSQGTLLLVSAIVIIPALMIFISIALKSSLSRMLNIILGGLFILVNISNLTGDNWAYYWVFGILEICTTLLIVRYAWRWQTT